MSTAAQQDWQKDFGLDNRKPPDFFSSVDELDKAAGKGKAPQPHALRRAFEQLGIDGVLCQERSPVVYFRRATNIDATAIANLHRSFWNQGIAPILVIIAPDEVHIYSGLIPPEDTLTDTGRASGFVETLGRVQDRLRTFLLAVETGEYFRVHRRSFDPRKRVDRDLLRNLQTTRQKLGQVQAARLEPQTLDALLCRLVFTCYLFDRGIIDRRYLKAIRIHGAEHLKDILAKKPRTDAKADLYKLFEQLGNDFNGDLFSVDLEAESRQVRVEHLEILDLFFQGTDVRSGQQAFWPYEFGFIPIETISAIYEHFLKAAGEEQKKEAGAFYTPRFLAEFVLDVALEGETSLLDKRFLDPACGSGIFLVGLFNRLAEEWNLKNPRARYDRRAKGLMNILRSNLCGVDNNPSACQITAFSLYLAFLDQLSPPDIQKLLGKWDRLPALVFDSEQPSLESAGTIRRADFFTDDAALSQKANVIVGNPPWGPVKNKVPPTPAEVWCAQRSLPVPNREKSIPFVWKAPSQMMDGGKVCLILPHGVIFNHSDEALRFQAAFFRTHAVERIINLTDYQRFLFEESEAPAIVARFIKPRPSGNGHRVEYWSPKTDWRVTQAELIAVNPQDRIQLTVSEILVSLSGDHKPLVWKVRHWATGRDVRLLDRLMLMPRLSEHVRQPREYAPTKTWLVAEGCQPLGPSDDPTKASDLTLPSQLFLQAKSNAIQLVLCETDCDTLPRPTLRVRSGSNKVTEIFHAPHVLINHGFTKIAFATFPVAFFDSIRAIHGPDEDKDLLAFLTAYLRSPIAKYFQFYTSSTWGVAKQVVDSIDLLRTPFPKPEQLDNPRKGWEIVREVAAAVAKAKDEAARQAPDREGIVQNAQEYVDKLIDEYFDIDDVERMLIADTGKIIIPSVRPSRSKPNVPTIKPSSNSLRASYTKLLCDRLKDWAKQEYKVNGKIVDD
jgi:hypothetical protein